MFRTLATSLRQPIASTSRLPSAARSLTTTIARSSESAAAAPPVQLSEGEQLLKSKLESSLDGAKVEVQDVSGGCGTFYAISVAHSSFKGLSTIKQHRLVNQVLADDIKGMHGMQLKTTAQ